MPRQVTITLYKFEELESESVKDNLRNELMPYCNAIGREAIDAALIALNYEYEADGRLALRFSA